MRIWMPMVLGLSVACGDKEEEGDTGVARVEGTEPGDCTDGDDNDGDGETDCDDSGCEGSPDCATDADGDGYSPVEDGGEDCDDTDPAVHPDAQETCNEVDDDCDGDIDEDAIDALTWYPDADGDGHGDQDRPTPACAPPSGHLEDGTDCDDSDAEVSPEGTEVCNDEDDDCDGEVDEDPEDGDTWYRDLDGDGYGDGDNPVRACEQPTDAVDDTSDCDDTDEDIKPGVEERCNYVDDDCDGLTDGLMVPGDFAGIQDAIYGGSAGDLVCVEAGTWTENLDFVGKDLRVESLNGAASTTIDGGGAGPVASFTRGESTAATLRGFTLTGGAGAGAAVRIDESGATLSELVIEGLRVGEETDIRGGLVSVSQGELVLTDCELVDNEIDVSSSSVAYVFGGVLGLLDSTASLSGVEIRDNTVRSSSDRGARVYGGAVAADGSDITLNDVLITGTMAESSSDGDGTSVHGVGFWGGHGLTVEASELRIEENTGSCGGTPTSCYLSGGGFEISEGDAVLTAVSLVGNVLDGGAADNGQAEGGGLFMQAGALDAQQLDVRDNALSGAFALYGGGIDLWFVSDSELDNVVVAGNSLASAGGSSQGGGIYARPYLTTVTLTNADIVGNTADGDASALGGGLYAPDQGDVVLVNVGLVENVVSSGGTAAGAAVHVQASWDSGELSLGHCNIYDNVGADAFSGVSDPTGSDGNTSVDPQYTDTSSTDAAGWDLHLPSGSGCVDAGDPSITDTDGSVSDIGAYGGPYGSW